MTIVSRAQFNKMEEKIGGDFWNQYKLCAFAFNKYPDAQSVSYSIGTGLWVNFTYTTKTGEEKEGVVYDGENYW